jgi:Fe-S cluster biogenesis protein NfuA
MIKSVPDRRPGKPPPAPDAADSLRTRVEAVVAMIRPAVQADGGDVRVLDVSDDGVVRLKFSGACVGCPSMPVTLQHGIERNVREKVPEVRAVVAET